MSSDLNKKSVRRFHCRDVLWETFEQMAEELECSVDYLINEAMKRYVRQRNQPGQDEPPSIGAPPPSEKASAPGRPPLAPLIAPQPPPSPPHLFTASTPSDKKLETPAAPRFSKAMKDTVMAFRPSAINTKPAPPMPPRLSASLPSLQPPANGGMSNDLRSTKEVKTGLEPHAPPARSGPEDLSRRLKNSPSPSPIKTTSVWSGDSTEEKKGAAPSPLFPERPFPISPAASNLQPGRGIADLKKNILEDRGAPARAIGNVSKTSAQNGELKVYYNNSRIEINKDRFVIGRGKQISDLTLKDPNVSRQHAIIEFQNNAYFIIDAGSTNGVEYNGQRITRKQIAEGDVFFICDHELRFSFS